MPNSTAAELIDLTQKLLDSIAAGDWQTYQILCDSTLSAFEPESKGHLVEGLEFHQYYFGLSRKPGPVKTTIASPRVRFLGDNAAVVTYIRLQQRVDDGGAPYTTRFEETRVWQRQGDQWKHVHFHRSDNR